MRINYLANRKEAILPSTKAQLFQQHSPGRVRVHHCMHWLDGQNRHNLHANLDRATINIRVAIGYRVRETV